MRPHIRSLLLLMLASGALLVGESVGFAQQYYGPAYGPPPSPPPPSYHHPRYAQPYYYTPQDHNGFFVQLTAGAGFLTASETIGGQGATYSGFGFTASGLMGGAIAPNLILFGEVLGTSIVDADLSSNGTYQGSSGYDMTMFGIGPGILYYFEPVNVYVSGTLAFTKMFISYTGNGYPAGDTNWGLGADFKGGKEWWVGPRLGIGIAGMVHLASMKDPQADNNMTATAFSLLFSASFD